METLWSLGTKKIYIVGGQGVVSKELEADLTKTYSVERVAGNSKDGRYGTNAAVAKKVLEKTKATTGILVSAEGYADALSVASIAASKGYPILFGNKSEVPNVVKEASKGLKAMAVGGEGVLPDKVLAGVSAERIAKGVDRFSTNLKVLDYFKDELKFNNIFVAAGGDDSKHKFADALVASAAAAKYGSPLVLNGLGTKEESKTAANDYIKGKLGRDTKVTIIGGAASIDAFIESELKNKAEEINSSIINNEKDPDKKPVTEYMNVQSIEALSLHQIKVVFNKEVNKDLAENLIAYQIDDKNLLDAEAKTLDDGKTVIITFKKALKEGSTIRFKVREDLIRAKNTEDPVKEEVKSLTLIDKQAPTVQNIESKGNKIYINFSEGISYDALKKVDNFKLDGDILDSSKVFIEPIGEISKVIDENGANIDIVNGIVLKFSTSLDKGQHTLLFPIDDSLKIVDTANLSLGKDAYTFEVK